MGKQFSLKEFKELLPMLKDEVMVSIDINDKGSTNNELINALKDYILLLEEINLDFLLPVDIENKIVDTIEILRYNIQYQEKTSVKLEDIISSITIENLMNLSHDLYILTRCNKVTNLCDHLIKLLDIKENKTCTELDKTKDDADEYYKKCIELIERVDGMDNIGGVLEKIHERFKDGKIDEDIQCPKLTTMLASLHFDAIEFMFSKTNNDKEINIKLFKAFEMYVMSVNNVVKMMEDN